MTSSTTAASIRPKKANKSTALDISTKEIPTTILQSLTACALPLLTKAVERMTALTITSLTSVAALKMSRWGRKNYVAGFMAPAGIN